MDNSMEDPAPAIAAPQTTYWYANGCYHFAVKATYRAGGPVAGALVSIWIRPASGPGSFGSPAPRNAAGCGATPSGANPGACVYVPPPTFNGSAPSDANGTARITIGMPVENYSVVVYVWKKGTETTNGSLLSVPVATVPTTL
ncbi:MAG: hypothetical protein ACYDDF_02310 [Thermoplasmatota archaeon]